MDNTKYHNWTETRFFAHGQIQDVVVSEFSDNMWYISEDEKITLNSDIQKAMDESNDDYHFEFGIHSKFTRNLPLTTPTATDE